MRLMRQLNDQNLFLLVTTVLDTGYKVFLFG